jgi:hypothetical protein
MIHTINDIKRGQEVITKYGKPRLKVLKVFPHKEEFTAKEKNGEVWTRIHVDEVVRICRSKPK